MDQFDRIKTQNHSHAWRGSWERPMRMDEDLLHPFTIARMTDHNVRGNDRIQTVTVPPTSYNREVPDGCWESEGGSIQIYAVD